MTKITFNFKPPAVKAISEQQTQSLILKYLNDQGYYTVKVISASRAGVPDILACSKEGKFIGIEVKSVTGKASKLQQHHIDLINTTGGRAFVVRSLPDLIAKLRE